jgi:hypothetical protein
MKNNSKAWCPDAKTGRSYGFDFRLLFWFWFWLNARRSLMKAVLRNLLICISAAWQKSYWAVLGIFNECGERSGGHNPNFSYYYVFRVALADLLFF